MRGNHAVHVLFIADIPIRGGATNCLIELVRCLQNDHGIRCTVCTAQESELNQKLSDIGVSSVVTSHDAFLTAVSSVNWRRPASFVKHWFTWKLKNLWAVRTAEQAIDFADVDIVHSNLPRNDLGLILARRHGIPHICHLRENSFEDFHLTSLKHFPERYLSNGSDALIAVSQSVKDNWVRRGADASKIHVIYDGIDSENVNRYMGTERRRARDLSERMRCIFLGGYFESKGLMSLLEAVEELDDSVRSKLFVSVYGEGLDSANGREALDFVNSRGLGQVIELNGYAEDVPQLLACYDVGLACSRAEAFGRIVLEYRAAGLAVVAARSGSFPELINDGVNGYLYDDGRCGATLKDILTCLAKNPAMVNRAAAAPYSIRTERDVSRDIAMLYAGLLEGMRKTLT